MRVAAVRRSITLVDTSRATAARGRSTSCVHHVDVRPTLSSSVSASVGRDVTSRVATTPQHTAPVRRKRLAVFVSGGGSNFKSIQKKCEDGTINADVVAVVSDKSSCGGVEYAESLGIPTLLFPKPKQAPAGKAALTDEELIHQLTEVLSVDYVLLAGYLKLIPASLIDKYPSRMLNIHPGLLPAFGGKGMYGARVHAAVIQSGARYSGPTVHFVDSGYDTGPILDQALVRVNAFDTPATLAARVLREEHRLFPEAVAALCDERITWRDDGIPVIWTAQ